MGSPAATLAGARRPSLDDAGWRALLTNLDRLAGQVQSGGCTYTEVVGAGMYRPPGQGDVDVEAIIGHLRGHCYDGWYVLGQDTILTPRSRAAKAR